MLDLFMPVRLYAGEGCVKKHGAEFGKFGKRCILVTGKHAARESGALANVLSVLAAEGISYVLYDAVRANPLLAACREAGVTAAESGAEFVIGIGGGSPLDAAKAVSVFAANPALDEDGFYAKKWENDPLPVVLVGTTAGTGSEVTKVAVLTDSKGRKHSIHDDRLYAALSLGDPRYTLSLPAPVTLSSGIDVLAHCMESYFSKKADSVSRAFAVAGIRLLYDDLAAAEAGGELSLEARGRLYEASLLGGLAINTTGTCFPHNVGYYLTENCRIPHGWACAVFLPDMLEAVAESCPAETEAFFRETGRSREEILALIQGALPELTVRMTEEEIAAALPRWEDNGSVKNTLADMTAEKIGTILRKKFLS